MLITAVGYGARETGNSLYPVVGSIFFTLEGTDTYDLSELCIPGVRDAETGEATDFCDPYQEFIITLDPASAAKEDRYTYISKEYIEMMFDPDETTGDWSKYDWALGWWKYDMSFEYWDAIDAGDDQGMKISDPVPITNGQAFLGCFSNGHSLRIQSNGEVVQVSTAYETAEALYPFFVNYLPVDIQLSDITIPGLRNEKGVASDFCDPYQEFIITLDPASAAKEDRYTYISKEYIEMMFDPDETSGDWAKYDWALGWWKYDMSFEYWDAIDAGDDQGMKLTSDPEVVAGDGFLGCFSNGHSLPITFPAATLVPSKQK